MKQDDDYTPPDETVLEPEAQQQEEGPLVEDVEIVIATPTTGISMYDLDTHIKSVHLRGKALQLTISAIGKGVFGKPMKKNDELEVIAGAVKTQKRIKTAVMFFNEIPKMLHLSPTNRNRCIELFGDDPAQWIGKTVILQAEPQKVGNKMEHPVRVQVERSKAANANKKSAPKPAPGQKMSDKDKKDTASLFGGNGQQAQTLSLRERYGMKMQEAKALGLEPAPIAAEATEAEIIAAGRLLKALIEQAEAARAFEQNESQ